MAPNGAAGCLLSSMPPSQLREVPSPQYCCTCLPPIRPCAALRCTPPQQQRSTPRSSPPSTSPPPSPVCPHLGAVGEAAPVCCIHHPHQPVRLLKVVAPVGPQRLLAPHVPQVKLVPAAVWGPGGRGSVPDTAARSAAGSAITNTASTRKNSDSQHTLQTPAS